MKLRIIIALVASSITFSVFSQKQILLDEVIALALENGYDVRLSKNALEAVSTDNNFAVGGFLPQLNGTASTTWNNNNQKLEFQDASRNNSGKAESNNTAAGVQLSWLLFDGTRMFATRERLAEMERQGEVNVKNQMVNTIAQVVTNYYNIIQQKQQLRALEELMLLNEERVRLADRKLSVGAGIKQELLQAKLDLNAQRTQFINQQTAIEQLKNQLNVLVGMKLPGIYEVSDSIEINLNITKEEIADNIDSKNFLLQSMRQSMSVAQLQYRERFGEYFPTISFGAAYNYSFTDNKTLINPFQALSNRSNGYNYGFTLGVPILNNFVTRRNVQQAQINFNRQGLLYDQQRAVINTSVHNAYVNYDNARKILLIEEENILLAKENTNIAMESFKRGVSTFIEQRTAQQSLEDAYNRLINARYLAKVAETELLRLSGDLLK
ncbi:MAG TPA: TolC family protein [Cyclobacteriaceae bacterium]|jgi:outer membrane protein|nr:TolC family protein [Cytophagales bacterium]HRE68111.1 TolC family protein [Cyclobacteriaceae bacterium]HRF34720.1 TolC family protein [Cyclobacteriaceae bacterium]